MHFLFDMELYGKSQDFLTALFIKTTTFTSIDPGKPLSQLVENTFMRTTKQGGDP
jgi:hypothetical protein